MATQIVDGPYSWRGARDNEGHREYVVVHRVKGAFLPGSADGPANVMQTPGLPAVGSQWSFDGDSDIWAWCRPGMQVSPEVDGEQNEFWRVEQTFSTKPMNRCHDTQIENPLLEPVKISVSNVRYTEEATHDKDGDPILNSAHEQMRGPQVEFDKSRFQVVIEQNVAVQGLTVKAGLIDHVNNAPLWGLGTRRIKFSLFSSERKFHGLCQVYYTEKMTFDIDGSLLGFDRTLLDEGSKVLRGHWGETSRGEVKGRWYADVGADPDNPSDFIRAKDSHGENMRVILNHGVPVDIESTGTGETVPGEILVEKYEEGNLLLLGIPLSW